jgi:chromate reductase, NAD(P)H dehydrogenase (quinone)
MTTHKVGYLIGSLAKGSINRRLAKALVRLAPPELEMSEISFKDLPLYSYDYDADYPPAGKAFKDAIAAVNAVLFVTPEYNRSIPGGLKNAIDWASRPTAPIRSRASRRQSSVRRRARSAPRSRSRICAASLGFAIHLR